MDPERWAASDGGPLAVMTLAQLAERYLEDYVMMERPESVSDFKSQLKTINTTPMKTLSGPVKPFGEWQLGDVLFPTLQQFKRVPRERASSIGKNRLFRPLRAMFNSAMDEDRGYVTRTPFKTHATAPDTCSTPTCDPTTGANCTPTSRQSADRASPAPPRRAGISDDRIRVRQRRQLYSPLP